MKRCPTCDKTFDDNLKFCQIDGTALAGDPEEVDPFKTMVASKDEIAAAMASLSTAQEPMAAEEQVLEIPEPFDSGKTQVVSEAELRAEMARLDDADENVIDVPSSSPEPEAPKFIEPSIAAPEFSSPPPDEFLQSSPAIPSPFGDARMSSADPVPSHSSTEPASPFSSPEPPASPFSLESDEPEALEQTPQFAEPEPEYNPFEHSAPKAAEPLAKAEWTPPAAIQSNMQDQQNFGQNPPVAASGQNKILPIVSLATGIISLCCWIGPLTGLIALITGFMGMKNANNDPANYGGKTLAIVGMILGGLFFVTGVAYWIFIIFFNGLAMIMQATQ